MKVLLFSLIFCLYARSVSAQNIFPPSGNVGIGTTNPAALLQVTGNARLGGTKNYAVFDSSGSLSFAGNSVYKVGANRYAFQYAGNPNYGLFFNAASLQYEFRNGNAASVFSINAGNGATRFGGSIYIDSTLFLQGNPFMRISDTANLFIGSNAGLQNTASYNTTLGYNTLFSNTIGYVNTAIGSYALHANISGRANTATGAYALYSNVISEANTATGAYALYNNQSGDGNTATGVNALYLNIKGWHNTSTGVSFLYDNISGAFQSAHGFEALYYNTTGAYNTATAYHALYQNTTGNYNVAIGVRAFEKNMAGSYNTALGTDADAGSSNLSNATVIGYNAVVNASNKVIIGNSAVTVIGGQVGWSTLSDGRFKKNIKQDVPGLNFINLLQPVTYTFDAEKYERFLGKNDSSIALENSLLVQVEKKVRSGFIAQQVEKAAATSHYDFDGVNKPQNDKDNYSLVYSGIIPSLVKSAQELSKENDDLKKEILDIKTFLQSLSNLTDNRAITVATSSLPISRTSISLEQNTPNPCRKSTLIPYVIPRQTSTALLLVLNTNATTLIRQKLAVGVGQITLDISSLASGVYSYFIIADGVMSESKKMIIEK